MSDTNTTADVPLTDPSHPLHRSPAPEQTTPAAPKAKASSTATKVAKPAKQAKASKKATATAKAPHVPSQIKSTEANPSKSIVPPKYKVLYLAHGGSNGDNVALALKTLETVNEDGRPCLDWKTIQQVARDNDLDWSAWEHLNAGQKRMNLGNKLRGMIKSGKTVTIGKKKIANIKSAQPVEEKKAA